MQVASRFIAVVAALGLVGAYASQSTSTAQTAAPLQRTKAWKALGRVGACAETTITKIADASDNPLSPIPFKSGETLDKDGEPMMDQGTYVQYQSGAEQIDAEWNAGVAHSKLGAPVRLCMVWKPKKCPPGDDRGRIYKATNLRTNETWQMSESWHSCGGA